MHLKSRDVRVKRNEVINEFLHQVVVAPSNFIKMKEHHKETADLADLQLPVLFRELGLPDVGLAHGVVQAFHGGHFMYHDPGCPNNFSIFCFL